MPPSKHRALHLFVGTIAWGILLGACQAAAPPKAVASAEPGQLATETATPFQPVTNTPILTDVPPTKPAGNTVTAAPAAASELAMIWLHPGFVGAIQLPTQWETTRKAELAAVALDVKGSHLAAQWTYALAAGFATIEEGVDLQSIQEAWRGEGPLIFMSGDTAEVFESLWGERNIVNVRIAEPNQLVQQVWSQPGAWTLLPFDQLDPQLKVLSVDGQSPLAESFDPQTYPLSIEFYLSGDVAQIEQLLAAQGDDGGPIIQVSNRDPAKLTRLVMTGVTALVRATAHTMEQRGILYPALDIGHWLREADITHISNEVPFAENCPPPNPVQPDLIFCSDPSYMALLQDVGTDVVELTGDHFHDWGDEAMLYTLSLYDQAGWSYYGGGRNFDEGRQAVLLEHNGNKFAFIGCNGKGGTFARATENTPGSVRCDFDWMHREINRLTADGYLVIATFQHIEYYAYWVPEAMAKDFRDMAQAGAVIVSGSQAHHPHGFEFFRGAFIHYGLGNLFFDQYSVETATAQGFVDRHIFYNGRHISTELLTLAFVDFARSRPMTAAERGLLLENVFSASGWTIER